MNNLRNQVNSIFSACQEASACHQINSIKLRKLYQQTDLEEFWEAIVPIIGHIQEVEFKTKNPYIDRMIEFIGTFCAALSKTRTQNNTDVESLDESFIDDPLIAKLIDYLLLGSDCDSETIRLRACQLINKIFDNSIEADISDERYEAIKDALLERLRDSKGDIRIQAILALYRLQNLEDPEDPVIAEFIYLLHDYLAKVRKVVVEKIAIRRDVVNFIIKRTRDVDINVRLAAFKRISKLVRALKIDERVTVLMGGKYDSCEKNRNYVCTELLSSWWEIYNYDILLLMKSLRLDADEKDIQQTSSVFEYVLNQFYFKNRTVTEILEVLELNNEKLLPFEKLNWETITYWKLLIMKLISDKDLECYVEKVVPEVVFLCRYIKEFSELDNPTDIYLETQYILKQLFLMIKVLDLSDPHTINNVHALVEYVLKNGDLIDDTMEAIIGVLVKTLPDPDTRCRFGMEIISDILYPVDYEEELQNQNDLTFKMTKLKTKSIQLSHEQDEAVKAQDFLLAERLKGEIESVLLQLKNLKNTISNPTIIKQKKVEDLPTVCKCLDIAWAILRCVTKLTPTLKSIQHDFLPDLLSSKDDFVRLKALRCYAICCIYDKKTAGQGIHIYAAYISGYQVGLECDTQTLICCISAISDLIRLYDGDFMAAPIDNELSESVDEEHEKVFAGGTALTSLIQGLVDLTEDEEFDVRLKAWEGLCKIILDDRIQSPALIARLILQWCIPADTDDSESQTIKQFIGFVLVKLPLLREYSEQLEGGILLTIDKFAKAPSTSPLAKVNIDNVVKFMLALCKLSSKGDTMRSNIILALCTKINENPTSEMTSLYSKILLIVDLPEDQNLMEQIFVLIDEVREDIDEKIPNKNITKLLSKVSERLNQPLEQQATSNIDAIVEEGVEEEEEAEEVEID
ncbi:unnamed protein product [Ceutorhynchus assimilis]|uniref:Nuclear condensin complex subunit 3 C-terminal domain-containing protein n=1 Tax=Ceutorhynchus assimilis TaxID=467358 RepID=A0A9N9MTR7_9CUCU|nr:unnamed protein product [Ceutorhynchus assimilis]